ncbi:LOW QUALITY PROTEIN: WD repeat-containing and planar cell polarity effector protein fritz homolog [Megalops cyprinoides]|uniref:LOW QUALITY PROTEIN: WD repeat-containing and planar cell polarity effector protein fritz homolog n=1 Tax=Megalops cyprinoides TaxID=118141 RepID=UPI0018642A8F|nr:LOW QUALITY PROTEIN: WD repeat-containing and planar cell polarity effector protein fritz homolog [Megalops cyprinoides]
MSFCLADLHLWSSKSTLHIRDTDIGTYQYYDKGEPVNLTDQHYFNEKQDFVESRGLHWTPKNSRPEKLRDSLKELEELLQAGPCVCSRWRNKQSCQMLLGSGVLVTLSLSGPQLERVSIDRALVGRLAADTISDAVITDRFLLLTFVEKNKVCLVHLAARRGQSSPDLNRRVEKLSLSELKISCVDLPGPAGRRLGRRVGLNCLQDVAICWWPAVNEEAWPWSPVPSEGDRANLVLLACCGAGGLKVLSCIRTEGDPLDCRFSLSQPYQVLTVELGARDAAAADSCVYECARRHLQRLAVTSLPLSARPVCCCRDHAEGALLLGLQDSSLVLWDGRRGLSLLAQVPMLPSLLAWHPAGALLLVGGGQGELQCFDAGLSPVALQLVAEDPSPRPTLRLSQHLRGAGGLAGLQWGAEGLEVHDLLFLTFHSGPVGVLRFRLGALNGGQLGPVELLQQRLRCGEVEEVLGLLGAMDWSTMGAECYRSLTAIADHLLRLELTAEREAQLEAALGMFYAPSRPLSDTVVLEYRDPISKYARRFFHHLLRYQRFEKAFLLAVDIGARDLFMDIHYVARDKGELVLADVARKRANEIDAESITTGPGEPQWSDACNPAPNSAPNSAPPDGRTGRRWDEQAGWKAQPQHGEGSGHTPSSGRSQDGLASRATRGGHLTRTGEEVFSRTVPSDQSWRLDWRQAGLSQA